MLFVHKNYLISSTAQEYRLALYIFRFIEEKESEVVSMTK